MKVSGSQFQNRVLLKSNESDLVILTAKSTPILLEAYSNLTDLRNRMLKIMTDSNGRGLAAPQVGLNRRVLIMKTEKGDILFMVNPEIVKKSSIKMKYEEGCLSVPGKQVNKNRSRQVTVKYFDEYLAPHVVRLGNVDSVCVQHEIDHLDGKLI